MTRSSKAIHLGLGVLIDVGSYAVATLAIGFIMAREAVRGARSVFDEARAFLRPAAHEPEPDTVEDLIGDEGGEVAVIVIADSTERAAANDQRWN